MSADPAATNTTTRTMRGRAIADIVAANPNGRLKAVEYDIYGGLTRIEWHNETERDDYTGPLAGVVVERVSAYTGTQR